jgi:hypothetical protein
MWKNLEIRKGNAQALKFYIEGDITSNDIIFACKESKNPSAGADILKKNLSAGGSDTEIFLTYNANKRQTEVKVFLVQGDTINLTNTRYFYSLKNDTTNNEAYVGKLYLIESLYGSTTSVTAGFRYYNVMNNTERDTIGSGLTSADEGLVWCYVSEDKTMYFWDGTKWV